MTDTERLIKYNQELETISAKIESLYEKQYEIEKKIRDINDKKFKITNDILDIKVGTNVIAINRNDDYHYVMFEFIKILDAHKQYGYELIRSTYRADDSDYSFKTVKTSVNNPYFHNLYDTFDLVTVSDEDYQYLLESLQNIDIHYENKGQYVEQIYSKSINKLVRLLYVKE
jgi:hypothetical protein